MAGFASLPRLSFEEFLNRNERSESKLEYLQGVVYAMAGASGYHNGIAARCLIALGNRLRGKGCEVMGPNQMVELPKRDAAFYPDVLVVCGSKLSRWNKPLDNPVLVIEILSPSTRLYNLGTKLSHYQRVPALRHILFVDSEKLELRVYSRGEGKVWPGNPAVFLDRGQTIALAALGIELSLDDIYEGLDFAGADV